MKLFIFIIVTYLISNKIHSQRQNDILDGEVKFFYENGKVSSEGFMRNGKPDGYWKSYYPDGTLKSEGNRRFFMLDSVWIFYNEKGDTSKIINYKNDKKHGFFISYEYKYDSLKGKHGGIVSKELYLDDVKQGISYYYKNGKLYKQVYYENGKRHGLEKEYDNNGNLITITEYKNDFIVSREQINRIDDKGLKQGIWKEFYPNNKISKEIKYKNDTIVGVIKEYDIYGSLISKKRYDMEKGIFEEVKDTTNVLEWREEYYENGKLKYYGAYNNGIKVGLHKEYEIDGKAIIAKEYNENGQLIAEGIIDTLDRKQSEWKLYYETGEIKAKGRYQNNQRVGEWVYYFIKGNIEQKGSFKKNKYNGKWVWYNENRNIRREEYYEDGKEEGEFVEYNDTGKVILKGKYLDGERTGLWIYDVGDIIEIGKYVEGMKDSVWKSIYINGKVAEIGGYLQGQKNGKYKWYNTDGTLKLEGYYIMGKKEKNWYYYDGDGKLYLTIKYKNDKEIKINGKRVKLPKGSFE